MPAAGGISGEIQELGVGNLIQMFASAGAVGTLALRSGAREGVVGFENGGIQIEDVGRLETKNVNRWRLKWYVTIAVQRPLGCAVLDGVKDS